MLKPPSLLDQEGGPDLGADPGRPRSPRDSVPAAGAQGQGGPGDRGGGAGDPEKDRSGSTPGQPASPDR